MLFDGRQEAGQCYANGIQPRRQSFAVKNSLGVRKQANRSSLDGNFGNNLDRRAHLRCSGGITHNYRKLAGGGP